VLLLPKAAGGSEDGLFGVHIMEIWNVKRVVHH